MSVLDQVKLQGLSGKPFRDMGSETRARYLHLDVFLAVSLGSSLFLTLVFFCHYFYGFFFRQVRVFGEQLCDSFIKFWH